MSVESWIQVDQIYRFIVDILTQDLQVAAKVKDVFCHAYPPAIARFAVSIFQI